MSFQDLVDLSRDPAYRGFYVPHVEIRIAGRPLPDSVINDVVQVTYIDNVRGIDSVDLTVNNWDASRHRFKYVGSETADDLPGGAHPDPAATLFEPGGSKVEVWQGYLGELKLVSTVYFTTMETSFSASGAPTLQVRGLNVLHTLRKKQFSYAWYNQRPSDIAEQLAQLSDGGKKRLPLPMVIDQKARQQEARIDFIAQDNEYDIDFLLNLARRIGYELVLDEAKNGVPERLRFGPSADTGRQADYLLAWGESLIDFKPRLSTARQVAKVTVKGWDRARKKPIKVTVDINDKEVKRINPDLHRLLEKADAREELVVDEPVATEQEARQRARAIMLDQMKQMVTAEGSTVGLPHLRAGSRLDISGVGARMSGKYFVTETTHAFSEAGYTTRFKARREDDRGHK
jgi:phage protein D